MGVSPAPLVDSHTPEPPLPPSVQLPAPLGALPLSRSPERSLPEQPSLEQLKKQAKALLASVHGGDEAALERFARHFPFVRAAAIAEGNGASDAPLLKLAQAQLVIAREHGFASWARLRRAVELAPLWALLKGMAERPIDWAARHRAALALAAAGTDGLRVALEALFDPNAELRHAALRFIDHHATDACVPQLTKVAQTDPDPDARRLAVHALVCERCKPTPLQLDPMPVLLHSFRTDPNRRVRFNAALSLRPYLDVPEVQEALRVAAREDPSALVRRAAVRRLRGDGVLPLLADVAQRDSDALVRVSAASRLGGDAVYLPLARRVLEPIAQSEGRSDAKRDAHNALRRISPEYRERVAQQAREANRARAAVTATATVAAS
jgi:hypothetical protein